VLIVGRVNTGKSTLFNRITGKRKSIFHNTPNITRDIIESICEWNGYKFILCDTGGLSFEKDSEIVKEIHDTVYNSTQQADVIIFLVDGRAGVLPLDSEIAEMLRKTKANIILAINKCESKKVEESASQFYELGFSDYCLISAEHGIGIYELLDKVTSYFIKGYRKKLPDSDYINVAIIGKPNVGKSTLLNAISGQKRVVVSSKPFTTRDSIDINFKYKGYFYTFYDTAGIRDRKKVSDKIEYYSIVRAFNAIKASRIVLLVIDTETFFTRQDKRLLKHCAQQGAGCILVVNKWDLFKGSFEEFEKTLAKAVFNILEPRVVRISALKKKNIGKLLNAIDEIREKQNVQIKTPVLNKILRNAIKISPPPGNVKLKYAVQLSSFPLKFALFTGGKKFGKPYIRYLENVLRENFDFTGLPIKFQIK